MYSEDFLLLRVRFIPPSMLVSRLSASAQSGTLEKRRFYDEDIAGSRDGNAAVPRKDSK
jgi:hypothetical protein